MESASERDFKRKYQSHLKHLKLKGMQPKSIDAYSRALRRIGARFKFRIDDLSEKQLTDYFTELLQSHSWSGVKLDLYGLKFVSHRVGSIVCSVNGLSSRATGAAPGSPCFLLRDNFHPQPAGSDRWLGWND